MKKIYKPCYFCKGKGETEESFERLDLGIYEYEGGGTCLWCTGTGKSKDVIAIIE